MDQTNSQQKIPTIRNFEYESFLQAMLRVQEIRDSHYCLQCSNRYQVLCVGHDRRRKYQFEERPAFINEQNQINTKV